MRSVIIISTLLFLSVYALAEIISSKKHKSLPVSTTTYFVSLGDRKLPVKVQQYGEVKDLVFINLHDDEFTSVDATREILEKRGGLLIEIENAQKRNIRFRMRGNVYQFDPNRVFSRDGIRQSLEFFRGKNINEKIIDEVEKFGLWILRLIPENPKCVIALHNNSEGDFGITDYLPGSKRNEAAQEAHVEPGQDYDDLFLTTDTDIYSEIKESGYNILMQANQTAKDDGSLSIYCGRRNIRYVNLETEHGKLNQYREMIRTLLDVLDGAKPGRINYNFSFSHIDSAGNNLPAKGTKIFFNDQQVGEVSEFKTQIEPRSLTGKFSIKKKFPVYSNTDFFLMKNAASGYFIEIRIDPTREKKPLDKNENFSLISKLQTTDKLSGY